MNMNPLNWFKRSEQPYTDKAIQFHHDRVIGYSTQAELTAVVQSCLTLWENGLSAAESNNPALTPSMLAATAQSLGLSGESVWLIRDELIPVSAWTVNTNGTKPTVYQLTMPDTGGGRTQTALADEVLHFRIGSPLARPWAGTSPLSRAPVTADLLYAVEDALREVYRDAPIGTQIIPTAEQPSNETSQAEREFRGARGVTFLHESQNVHGASGPVPNQDWKATDMTPDLQNAMTAESHQTAKNGIMSVYGVLPALMNQNVQGPSIRECQRHLAQWALQPMANRIAEECTQKLEVDTRIDTLQPLQAYDAGGRARALNGVVQGLAQAKDSGLSDEQITAALAFAGISEGH